MAMASPESMGDVVVGNVVVLVSTVVVASSVTPLLVEGVLLGGAVDPSKTPEVPHPASETRHMIVASRVGVTVVLPRVVHHIEQPVSWTRHSLLVARGTGPVLYVV